MTADGPGIQAIAAALAEDERLERCAGSMARMAAEVADPLIDANIARAVSEWRLADATFWQRVKYRARRLRATREAITATAVSEPNRPASAPTPG